jgi:hypothetical protein
MVQYRTKPEIKKAKGQEHRTEQKMAQYRTKQEMTKRKIQEQRTGNSTIQD